jgi:hypothetical protein
MRLSHTRARALLLCAPQRVVVLYYLSDDSVQITEPKQDNSGIPQARVAGLHGASTRAQAGL